MIDPANLLASIKRQGINYFIGVPDSLLKDFCAHVSDNVEPDRHVICANEGNAIGLASGWYVGSGEPALVYMQDSGIGNSVNPLLSLADPEVYSIPMLLIVGWRGAPGSKDEPQHMKQGRVMPALLEAMEIPYFVLDGTMDDSDGLVSEACDTMRSRMAPVVVLVKPKTFSHFESIAGSSIGFPMSREDAVKVIVDHIGREDLIVSTTGKTSRELYEYRKSGGDSRCRDFLTVGSMGHASSIAMGLSVAQAGRRVICLDGDGSAIMHMGSMAIIGQKAPRNLVHVVLNNGAHESVGGQPTVGFGIDFVRIAESCGYRTAVCVSDPAGVARAVEDACNADGPSFIEVKVSKMARSDLVRPKESPLENRESFMTICGTARRR